MHETQRNAQDFNIAQELAGASAAADRLIAEREELRTRALQAEAHIERMYELQAQHTEAEGMLRQERDGWKRKCEETVAYAGELRSTMNEMLDLYDMHLRWGEIIERARKLTTPEGGGRNG